jgi:hypothetical protein
MRANPRPRRDSNDFEIEASDHNWGRTEEEEPDAIPIVIWLQLLEVAARALLDGSEQIRCDLQLPQSEGNISDSHELLTPPI